MEMESLLMTADEVAKELNVSKNYAYKVIRRMNEEMREKGRPAGTPKAVRSSSERDPSI